MTNAARHLGIQQFGEPFPVYNQGGRGKKVIGQVAPHWNGEEWGYKSPQIMWGSAHRDATGRQRMTSGAKVENYGGGQSASWTREALELSHKRSLGVQYSPTKGLNYPEGYEGAPHTGWKHPGGLRDWPEGEWKSPQNSLISRRRLPYDQTPAPPPK